MKKENLAAPTFGRMISDTQREETVPKDYRSEGNKMNNLKTRRGRPRAMLMLMCACLQRLDRQATHFHIWNILKPIAEVDKEIIQDKCIFFKNI